MSFDKFKPKYKIHEETENYFKLRAEVGAKPYDQLTVEEAREGNIANAKRFAGTTEFEGTVKEFTVPTKHCSDGKIHHFSLCITHFKALIDPSTCTCMSTDGILYCCERCKPGNVSYVLFINKRAWIK